MEQKNDQALLVEKVKVGLLAGILLALLIFSVGIWMTFREVRSYADSAGTIITRLDNLTAELDKLDVETMVSAANQVSSALDQAEIEKMVISLGEVSRKLQEVDWESLGNNMNDLAVRAQESLALAEKELLKAGEAIDEMDIVSLNQAIRDLESVIEPLAKLANRFK